MIHTGLQSTIEYPKIVGLMAVRNESDIIEQSLRALAEYADAIVVLDDASTDDTVKRVESLAAPCNVEKIIKKEVWIRDEKKDKNDLLNAGREIGGTHFIMVDADEMFTYECAINGWLRKQLKVLKPGQAISFPMMNLWDGITHYRDDQLCNPRDWRWRIGAAWCDDKSCNYDANPAGGVSKQIHVYRIPCNRSGNLPIITVVDLKHGLIHFKHTNTENIVIKKVWYMCLELINADKKGMNTHEKNAEEVNRFYQVEFALHSQQKYILRKLPPSWLKYRFFNAECFTKKLGTKQQEILSWFKEYGPSYFESLDIWHIDWVQQLKQQCVQVT